METESSASPTTTAPTAAAPASEAAAKPAAARPAPAARAAAPGRRVADPGANERPIMFGAIITLVLGALLMGGILLVTVHYLMNAGPPPPV